MRYSRKCTWCRVATFSSISTRCCRRGRSLSFISRWRRVDFWASARTSGSMPGVIAAGSTTWCRANASIAGVHDMADPAGELRARQLTVIAIGGSAGALEVLVDLLGALPRTFPAAVVVVVHLPADSDGSFAELLRLKCVLDVAEAEDKLEPAAGGVY